MTEVSYKTAIQIQYKIPLLLESSENFHGHKHFLALVCNITDLNSIHCKNVATVVWHGIVFSPSQIVSFK